MPWKDRPKNHDLQKHIAAGAAEATTRVLPEFAASFDGTAIRAPTPGGSIADITFVTERPVSVEEVNQIFIEEAGNELNAGILGDTHDPLVSADTGFIAERPQNVVLNHSGQASS